MGFVRVTVSLRAFESNRKKYEAVFLVDTGATDSMAPASKLRRIGIKPLGRMSYELADGKRTEFPFGIAAIEFMGDITAGRVIFGPEDTEPILGVTALNQPALSSTLNTCHTAASRHSAQIVFPNCRFNSPRV